jgi:hypothetical protein
MLPAMTAVEWRAFLPNTAHLMSPSPGGRLTTTWLGSDARVRVRDAVTGEELFAADEFTQSADGDSWVFRDTVTGAEARHCSPVVHHDQRSSLPARLRAAVRPVDIDVFLTGVGTCRRGEPRRNVMTAAGHCLGS